MHLSQHINQDSSIQAGQAIDVLDGETAASKVALGYGRLDGFGAESDGGFHVAFNAVQERRILGVEEVQARGVTAETSIVLRDEGDANVVDLDRSRRSDRFSDGHCMCRGGGE